jgi:hypothetical protein
MTTYIGSTERKCIEKIVLEYFDRDFLSTYKQFIDETHNFSQSHSNLFEFEHDFFEKFYNLNDPLQSPRDFHICIHPKKRCGFSKPSSDVFKLSNVLNKRILLAQHESGAPGGARVLCDKTVYDLLGRYPWPTPYSIETVIF